jgi:hypothetical protein
MSSVSRVSRVNMYMYIYIYIHIYILRLTVNVLHLASPSLNAHPSSLYLAVHVRPAAGHVANEPHGPQCI